MKREKLISCLCAAALAFLLGFGSTACMITGLNLPADLYWLALGCGVGALVAAICFALRRGGWIFAGIAALHCLLMLFSQNFRVQLQAMGYSAFQYYSRAYGVPIPEWFMGQTAPSQLLPLLLIAGLVMSAAAWTVMRRKRSFLAVPAALLPLLSCLIVTDTVPDVLPIFLLFLGLVLLMMTQSVRRRSEVQGNRLTAILVLPVCAALLGLVLLVPQGDYSAPEQISSMQGLFDWLAQQVPVVDQTSQGDFVISVGGNAKQEVNLTRVGRRIERNTPVMEVTTDYAGTLYLRGRDYDLYTGRGWEATQSRTEEGYSPSSIWCKDIQTASIQIIGRRGQYYLPCYPTQQQTLIGGMLPNPDYIKSYSYEFSPLRSDWQELWHHYQPGMLVPETLPAPDSRYLELPEATRQRAQEIVGKLFYKTILTSEQYTSAGQNDISRAAQIENYVKNSAVYDLDPGRMPGDEDDFALWLLEDSDKGYCVHFATAATVLLRAAGIPARYVEGYTIPTSSGTTIVREKQAHAWVEYYLDHIGWVILDPTPGAAEQEPTTEATEVPTTPTTPATHPTETAPSVTEPSVPVSTGQSQSSQPTGSQPIGLPGDSTGGGTPSSWVIPKWFITLLTVLVWTAAALLLVFGQWLLRRYWKQKNMHRGKSNAQALKHYREVRRLARLCGLPLPDELNALAQKAKFSQYALTQEELGQFDFFILEFTHTLQEKPWYYRLVCRIIFAAY